MLTGTAISAFSVSNNHTSEGDGTSDASRRRLLLLRSSRLRLDAITFLSNAQLSAWMHRTHSKGNDESTAVDSGRKVFPAIPEHTKVQGGKMNIHRPRISMGQTLEIDFKIPVTMT